MYPDWVGPAVAGFLAAWLGVLTYFIWQQGKFLTSLFPKSGERDIRKKFEEVLKYVEEFKVDLGQLKNKLDEVEKNGQIHIQRVGLKRYNPYDDTGGDQSFTVALLNNKGTGFVITSLHARSQTRVFAKLVVEGKSGEYQFSKEEEQVVKEALK